MIRCSNFEGDKLCPCLGICGDEDWNCVFKWGISQSQMLCPRVYVHPAFHSHGLIVMLLTYFFDKLMRLEVSSTVSLYITFDWRLCLSEFYWSCEVCVGKNIDWYHRPTWQMLCNSCHGTEMLRKWLWIGFCLFVGLCIVGQCEREDDVHAVTILSPWDNGCIRKVERIRGLICIDQ